MTRCSLARFFGWCLALALVLVTALQPVQAQSSAPGKPQNVAAVSGDASVLLTWNAIASATKWQVRYKAGNAAWGGWADIAGSGGSTARHTVTGLTNGTAYLFRVRAFRGIAAGPTSDNVSATPAPAPGKPQNVAAVPGDASVLLTWNAIASATKWQVRYKAGNAAWGVWADIAGSSGSTARHTVTGLTNGTAYLFRVRAFRGIAAGPTSDNVSATPAPAPGKPQNVAAVPGDGSVLLTWNAIASATKWQVRYKAGNAAWGGWADIAGSSGSTARHTVTGLTNGTAYLFRVRAFRGIAAGPTSDNVSATPAPAPGKPQNVSAVPGDGSVLLTWNAIASATKWQVRYKAGNAAWGGWADIAGSGGSTARHTVTGLTNGTAYLFRVRAFRGIAAGPRSDNVSATPAPAPGKPQNVSAVPGDGSVLLTWNAIATATKWQVRYKAGNAAWGGWADITGSGGSTARHTVTGLTNGTAYLFRVRAFRGIAAGPTSDNVSATPAPAPGKPQNVSAVPGDGSVLLTWNAIATATKWQVRYKAGNAAWGGWTDIAGSGGSTARHTVTGLTNGTAYLFRVRAFRGIAAGPTSDNVSATPAPAPGKPQNVAAVPGDASVLLTWNAIATATKWQVRYKAGNAAWVGWADIAGSGGSTARHTVTGLTNGTAYLFRVRAFRGIAAGPTSDNVSATPAPAPGKPQNVAAVPGDGSVLLTWNAIASATKWQVRYKAGNAAWGGWADITGSGGSTARHTVTGLTNGTAYLFRLRAFRGIAAGPRSDNVSATPGPAPGKPQNVSAVPGDGSVLLTWNAIATATKWQVRYKAGAADWTDWADIAGSNGSTTSHTITGLTNGTEYLFRVRALRGTAAGPRSDNLSVTPGPAPGKPQNVSAVPGDGSVLLTWNAIATATKWQVRYKAGAADWTDWADIAGSNGSTASHTMTGLTNGTEYLFRVRAFRGIAAGPRSDNVSATPGPAPGKPQNTVAIPGDGSVLLTWNAIATATKWQVRYKAGAADWTDWADIAGSNGSTASHTMTGLTNGTEYLFRVRALRGTAAGPRSDNLSVTPAANNAPTVASAITDQSVVVGSTLTVDLEASGSEVFADVDGDTLTYTATSEAPGVAGVSLSGTTLTVTGGALGTAAVTVTAEDPGGASVSDAFEVTVSNSLRTTAPTNVRLTGGAAQLTVAWDWIDGTGGICLLTGSRSAFEVEYKKSTESSWLQAYEVLPNSADRGVFELKGNGALRQFTIEEGAAGLFAAQTGVALDPVAYDVRVLAYSGPCEQPPHEPNSPYSVVASTSVLPAVSNASVADGGVMSAPGQVLPGSGVSGLLTFAGQSVEALRLREGRAVREELPEAQGGEGALTYALSPELPAGLQFDAATRTISGTPLAPVAETRYTLTVTETEASAEGTPQSASLSFLLEVGADTKPVFAQAVADMAFERNQPIEPRVLPLATGGEGELRYALEPFLPAGLYLDQDTRTISGTPETVREETLYRWTAVDSDGDMAVAEFRMTVVAEPSVASRAAWAHKAILPDLVRGATDMTLDAVGARTQQARTGDTQGLAAAGTGEAQLLGQRFTFGVKDNSSAPQSSALDSLPSLLQSTGPTLNTEDAGEALMQRMLEGASFRMHLGGGADGMGRRYTLWGQGGYRSLSAEQDGIAFSGGLSGLHLGADTRLSDTLLAGVAVSHSSAQMDYTETYRGEVLEGVYGFTLSGVHPYADWQHASGLGVWLSAGASRGEVQVWDRALEEQDAVRNALSVHALSGGVERPLARRGVWGLAFKADGSVSDVTVSDDGSADDIALRVSRLRMSVQADWELGAWSPYAELGLRHDGGAGGSGTGLEAGGGVRYSGTSGWQFEGEARSLALGSGSRREWQLQATLSRQPAAGAGGFRMRLSPAYGPAGGMSGVLDRLWSDGMSGSVAPALGGLLDAGAYQSRLDLELGYGWPVNRGLVELYGGGSAMAGEGVNPAANSSGRLHVGGRFEATSGWHVRLELQWDGSAADGGPSAPGGMNGDVFSSELFGGASASGLSGLADERLAEVGPHASEPGRYGDSLRALGAAPLNPAGRGIVLTISSRSLGR
ncbi:fibronectin type III domain-containing protein [Candidatus Foliamicus sp.]